MLETPLKILALKVHAELDDTVVVRMIPHFLVLTFKILMERKPYKRFWWYLKSRRIYLPKPSVPWISDWETLVLSRVTSDIHISCTQKGCLWLQATILIFAKIASDSEQIFPDETIGSCVNCWSPTPIPWSVCKYTKGEWSGQEEETA